MSESRVLVSAICLLSSLLACGQVAAPLEIKDPHARLLQQKYLPQLKAVAEQVRDLSFPYPFSLNRVLDVEPQQKGTAPQAGIRFDHFRGQTVLEMTGNYYASYSAELMSRNRRARKTFTDVMLPLLKAAAPQLSNDVPFQAFGFEISHHVRSSVLGVPGENYENFVLLLPRVAAERLVAAPDDAAAQSALLEGEAYLNGEPITLWMSDDGDPQPSLPRPRDRAAVADSSLAAPQLAGLQQDNVLVATPGPPASPGFGLAGRGVPGRRHLAGADVSAAADGNDAVGAAPTSTLHDSSPEALRRLQLAYGEKLSRMTQELASQAHFVAYAPPAFIPFRHGSYLEISVTTDLPGNSAGSQYRLAALAFDRHIAHLIRPVLAYFEHETEFDGIDFSTTIHTPDAEAAEAVEFVATFGVLRCYQQYDCTGQQLVNASFVLVNGERVSLELQSAEAEPSR